MLNSSILKGVSTPIHSTHCTISNGDIYHSDKVVDGIVIGASTGAKFGLPGVVVGAVVGGIIGSLLSD